MRAKCRKLIYILAILCVWFSSFAAAFPWEVQVTLDASKSVEAPANGKKLEIGNTAVTFTVPESWTAVCEKTVNAEGYQFRLNEISGSYRTEPEQLYIFCFDPEKYLADLSERQETKKIERAIVKNILPDEKMRIFEFPEKTVKRDGRVFKKYCYYMTSYKDTGGKRHNVEFVFLPSKSGEIVCAVYVFNTSDHRDEAISVLQSIRINGD